MIIKIREAMLEEAKQIYLKLLKKPYKDAYTDQLVIDLIKNKLSICLVAEVGNQIVGTLGARREGYKGYWLYFVSVKKEFQRKGIGRALMNHFFEKAKHLGGRKVASDTPNKKFLIKFGFQEVGKIPKWQKTKDQVIMFRKL